MSVPIELTFSSLFLFSLVVLADLEPGQNDQCRESSCGRGPAIRFPFRLKDSQPENCGYPGFDLSCTSKNETALELQNLPLKLFIRNINYKSQVMQVYIRDNCLPEEQLKSLNINISPFQLFYTDYTLVLFNCSSPDMELESYYNSPIPCLSDPVYRIYALNGGSSIFDLPLVSCTKLYNISSILFQMLFRNNDLILKWSKPNCGFCEAKGKRCRFSNHSAALETECFDTFKPKEDASRKPIISGVTVGSFFVILLAIGFFHVYNSDKKDKENRVRIKKFLEDYKAFKPSRYSFADIKKITNQFKENLGQGAYGTVYKGELSDEILVAVKILNNSEGNGEEFVNEVGTIGLIHHINVVRLVGYCADGFRRALVYEFLPNDSLQKYIESPVGANCSLCWETIHDIAVGIARGIEYLHQGCDQRIVHFDIKPHNILLDQNFTPKISDFGLAKLYAKDQSIVSMSTARGTMGYIAPEVFSRNFGNVSCKSDVYSFGMLLLELVGGRKITDVTKDNTSQIYYPEWIYNLLEGGEDLRIQIEEEGDTMIAKKLAIVGLWCIQWHPADRPSMKVVVHMLEGGEKLSMPPNPFASTSPSKTTSLSVPRRRMNTELEAIDELE